MAENNTITLKATDFQYPSKEELRAISSFKPKFTLFSFPYTEGFSSFFNNEENISLKETNKRNHLYWWNHSLENKIGSLTHAYTVALINFNRGFSDDFENMNDRDYINLVQFDFYCETYFYFFASVRDAIAQIINVYYNIGVDENSVYFKSIILKISDIAVKEKCSQFCSDTFNIVNYRNKFTHRFLITQPDYRTSYIEKDGIATLGDGLGSFTKSSDLDNQIKTSMEQIAAFITDLSKLMI